MASRKVKAASLLAVILLSNSPRKSTKSKLTYYTHYFVVYLTICNMIKHLPEEKGNDRFEVWIDEFCTPHCLIRKSLGNVFCCKCLFCWHSQSLYDIYIYGRNIHILLTLHQLQSKYWRQSLNTIPFVTIAAWLEGLLLLRRLLNS